MTDTLTQLSEVQRKADTIQQATEALKDSTKVLSDETIRDLITYAQDGARASNVDKTVAFRVASQRHANGKLHESVVAIWNRQLALQHDLDQIRRYHGFATAQALKEAVEAGKTAPVPVPATPVTPRASR